LRSIFAEWLGVPGLHRLQYSITAVITPLLQGKGKVWVEVV
jgi:hypothetical protein